jgi:hypothetical protein
MTDYFDFSNAAFAKPPKLAAAPGLSAGLAECTAQGLTPPLPGQPAAGSSSLPRSLQIRS